MKIVLKFFLCLIAMCTSIGMNSVAVAEDAKSSPSQNDTSTLHSANSTSVESAPDAPTTNHTTPREAWEVNGIRLEPEQVERLAQNVAKQTVLAVGKVEGLTPSAEQRARLETIYYQTALRVYEQAVKIVARTDLNDHDKETQIIDLVLDGQAQSTRQVEIVLTPAQYPIYRAWELRQIEAFKTRGLWANDSQKRGRRRTR